MKRTPKAVPPVELVASRPRARFELFGNPKLICPPVVWSPSVAPNLEAAVPEPYQPASAEMPSPPLPVARAGNAKSYGLPSEYVTPLMVTGLAVLTEVGPGSGRESKYCV